MLVQALFGGHCDGDSKKRAHKLGPVKVVQATDSQTNLIGPTDIAALAHALVLAFAHDLAFDLALVYLVALMYALAFVPVYALALVLALGPVLVFAPALALTPAWSSKALPPHAYRVVSDGQLEAVALPSMASPADRILHHFLDVFLGIDHKGLFECYPGLELVAFLLLDTAALILGLHVVVVQHEAVAVPSKPHEVGMDFQMFQCYDLVPAPPLSFEHRTLCVASSLQDLMLRFFHGGDQ